MITGNTCRQVASGDYIYSNFVATAGKICNNTCLESGRTVNINGQGSIVTLANNN